MAIQPYLLKCKTDTFNSALLGIKPTEIPPHLWDKFYKDVHCATFIIIKYNGNGWNFHQKEMLCNITQSLNKWNKSICTDTWSCPLFVK